MTNILLFRADELPFDTAAIVRVFSTQRGFQNLQFDELGGPVIEADYADQGDRTIVGLNENPSYLSLSGTRDVALQAALVLQAQVKVPLRIIDTNYSFDLMLSQYSTVDELRAAIELTQAD